MQKLAGVSELAHQYARGSSTPVKRHFGRNVAGVLKSLRLSLRSNVYFRCLCVCVGGWNNQSRPQWAPFTSATGQSEATKLQTERPDWSRLRLVCARVCVRVLWFLMYSLTHMQHEMSQSLSVCACVSSGTICLFLYLTSVMQPRLFNMWSQWGGFCPGVLLCVRAWVTVCANCVNIFSCCRFAPSV